MNTFKNIVQKLKELSVPKAPTKEHIKGSQVPYLVEIASTSTSMNTNTNPNPLPDPQVVNRSNNKVEDAVAESFWPNIRKYILADDPDAKPLRAICSVCRIRLRVTCISFPGVVGLIAPCGHIKCSTCWPGKICHPLRALLEDPRKCQVCQIELECLICRRDCIKRALPWYGERARIESFPETAPECGREYHPYCKECAETYHQQGDGFWFKDLEECESTDSSSAGSVRSLR